MGILILYPNDSGDGVSILTPFDTDIQMYDIALRDVPEGRPFIFVDHTDLPEIEFREATVADFSNPDGVGLGYEKFLLELEARKKRAEDYGRKMSIRAAQPKVAIPEPVKSTRSKRRKAKSDE